MSDKELDLLDEIKLKRSRMDPSKTHLDRSFEGNRITSDELDWLIKEVDRLRGDNLSYKVILDGLKKQMKILEGKDEDRSELIAEARKIVDAEHEHMKGTAYYLTPSSQMIEKLIAQAAKLQEINKNLMRNIGRK